MNTTSKIFGVLVSLIFAFNAQAKSIVITTDTEASTYKLAIVEGLKEAVARVSGLTIKSEEFMGMASEQYFQSEGDDNINITNFNKQLVSNVKMKLGGTIKSYDILSHDEVAPNKHKVKLKVEIEKYDVPGIENNRRGIAIIGFKANKATCFGKALDIQTQTDEVSRALVNAFTATRKFSVLDRDNEDVYQLEKSLIQSGDANLSEFAKLSQVKGTDYILTGLVKNLSITSNKQKIELSGDTFTTYQASIEIDFKLLAFATRQVKFASSVKVSLNHSEISGKNCSNILSLLAEKVASKITEKCIENIYPPIIASINGDKIFLNIGGDSVKIDSLYDVYDLGKKIIDPYTKESLGSEEIRIATLRVTEIKPKYSIGVLEKGDITKIKQGQICRPSTQSQQKRTTTKKKKKEISESDW